MFAFAKLQCMLSITSILQIKSSITSYFMLLCNIDQWSSCCYFINYELDYILAEENSRTKFRDNWQLYQPAIIVYCSAHKNKPAALKDALVDGSGGNLLMFCNLPQPSIIM